MFRKLINKIPHSIPAGACNAPFPCLSTTQKTEEENEDGEAGVEEEGDEQEEEED